DSLCRSLMLSMERITYMTIRHKGTVLQPPQDAVLFTNAVPREKLGIPIKSKQIMDYHSGLCSITTNCPLTGLINHAFGTRELYFLDQNISHNSSMMISLLWGHLLHTFEQHMWMIFADPQWRLLNCYEYSVFPQQVIHQDVKFKRNQTVKKSSMDGISLAHSNFTKD
ncbi:hypothetical protein PROFUN_16969, partial [Planoprotostelium fungivorum]